MQKIEGPTFVQNYELYGTQICPTIFFMKGNLIDLQFFPRIFGHLATLGEFPEKLHAMRGTLRIRKDCVDPGICFENCFHCFLRIVFNCT